MPEFLPKVSIIIPALNEEHSIISTLHALQKQTYKNFEIIVIDNNSTDRTAEVVKSFQADIPLKLVSETRKGTMWACEKGRNEAVGEIIVRVDADCTPDTEWLEKGVKKFTAQSVVGVSGPYAYTDAPWLFRLCAHFLQSYVYLTVNIILRLTNTGAVMIGGNSFMRATALAAIGGFNTSIQFYGDDTDTAKRLSRAGKVIFSPTISMNTSARRFNAEGTARLTLKYLYYFFRTIILHSQTKTPTT